MIDYDPEDLIHEGRAYTLEVPRAYYMSFLNGSDEIGRLSWDDGVMKFSGKADESARVFFDSVKYLFEDEILERAKELNKDD